MRRKKGKLIKISDDEKPQSLTTAFSLGFRVARKRGKINRFSQFSFFSSKRHIRTSGEVLLSWRETVRGRQKEGKIIPGCFLFLASLPHELNAAFPLRTSPRQACGHLRSFSCLVETGSYGKTNLSHSPFIQRSSYQDSF